jgi:hypothetical protein
MQATGIPASIRRDEAYPLTDFRAITRMTPSSVRSACRNGLATRKVGKRVFILGSDFLDYLASTDHSGHRSSVAPHSGDTAA